MLTAAVYTEQSPGLFLPWVLGFAVWREPRSGFRLSLLVALFAGAALLVLNLRSHGHFWIFIYDVMAHHPLLPDLFGMALVTLVLYAPYFIFVPPLTAWLGLQRKLPTRVAFWVGVAVNALVVSLITSSKVGAYINNIMTGTVFTPFATILVTGTWLASMPARSFWRPVQAVGASLLFGYLLSAQHFQFDAIVSAPGEWVRARALIRFVQSLPGTVLFPAHSFIPQLAGKLTDQFHEQGYVDVIGAGLESIDVTTCAAHLDARWLITNDKTEAHFKQLLEVAYERRGDLPPAVKMVLGKYTRPTALYERRPGDPWQLARRDQRTLFDFESGTLEGWERTGTAFLPGVTEAALEHQQPVVGHLGHRLLNSYHPVRLDEAVGTVTSPPFILDRGRLGFRAGGGASDKLRVELVVDGAVVRALVGTGHGVVEVLTPVAWDVSPWQGKTARVVIQDMEAGKWGTFSSMLSSFLSQL